MNGASKKVVDSTKSNKKDKHVWNKKEKMEEK